MLWLSLRELLKPGDSSAFYVFTSGVDVITVMSGIPTYGVAGVRCQHGDVSLAHIKMKGL